MSKTAIFVDISAQYRSVKLYNKDARINYERYLERALGDHELYRAYAYGVQMYDEATLFIAALNNIGYDTRYKQAKIIKNRPNIYLTSSNVDICVDTFRSLRFVERIVFGTNNPDITELIYYVKEQGIRTEIYSINIPRELRLAAHYSKEIENHIIGIKETNVTAESAE